MPVKANYLKRKYVQIEFEPLPSHYSVVIVRNQKLIDNSKEKNQTKDEESTSYNRVSRLKLSDFMISIGTTFGNLSGISDGFIYYNKLEDLQKDAKYSLFCIEEGDGTFRIDFLTIPEDSYTQNADGGVDSKMETPHMNAKAFLGSQLAFQNLDHHPLQKANKDVQQKQKWAEANLKVLENTIQYKDTDVFDENYQVPAMVFKGTKVPLITDRENSFIGVAEFL